MWPLASRRSLHICLQTEDQICQRSAAISLVQYRLVCCCRSSANLASIFSLHVMARVAMVPSDALFAILRRLCEKKGTDRRESTRGCASTLWEPDRNFQHKLLFLKLAVIIDLYKHLDSTWHGSMAAAATQFCSILHTASCPPGMFHKQSVSPAQILLIFPWLLFFYHG